VDVYVSAATEARRNHGRDIEAAEVLELKRKGVYQKDVVKITETGGVL